MPQDDWSQRIDAAASLLSVMAHPGRLAVLELLRERGPLSVGALQEALEIEQSALSHQLRLLRGAGLVRSTREGRRRIYALSDHHVSHIVHDAIAHAAELQDRTPGLHSETRTK